MVNVNPGSSFEQAQGHGHTTTRYKFWQHFKAFVIPSFCISSRKILFASLFYMVFCFISYMCTAYLALGQDETILGDNFVDGSRKVLSLWSLILCTLFHDFLHVYSPWAGADNTLGPTFWCQQEGLITLVIYSTSDFIDIFSWFNKCI